MPFRNARSRTPDLESRGRISSGGTPSSSRIDGVHREDGLVLRRHGRLGLSSAMLGGLKAAYFKATPDRFVTSKQIANEIRRLRGHDKSTIYERHAKFHEGAHSCPHHDELVSLCTRLMKLSCENTTDFAAERELIALSVEDPVVYELFRICEPSSVYLSFERDFFDIRKRGRGCHRRWSELLGRDTFKSNRQSETAQDNCDALKETFNLSERVAMEYLPYAMRLEMPNDDLVLLHQLWEHSLDAFAGLYTVLHCSENVDLCFRNIVSSGKSLAYFASPSQLEYIASYLVEYSINLPFVFSTFFPPPKFEFRNPKDPYGAKLVIRSPARNWDITTASSYAISVLYDDTRGNLRMIYDYSLPEFIKKYGTGIPLERTVFVDSKMVDLYTIINDAVISYRHAAGVLCDGKLEAAIHRTFVNLAEPSLEFTSVANSLGKTKKDKNVAMEIFYIAHTVDIDRYHKHAMLEKFKEHDGNIDVLNDRLRFQTYYLRPDGICDLTSDQSISSQHGLPESSDRILNLWNREIFPEDITIDTMPLDGKLLTCLRVDRESPVFYCDGHYPILAGFDFETSEPIYVAVVYQGVDSPWYFTTVKNGASSVTFMNEIGVKYRSRKFFVLCLRHDPIDLPPRGIQHRAGAKDPTGPVYWMEFWPKRDARYWDDERLRDDRLLESFLDESRERKNAESILDGFR